MSKEYISYSKTFDSKEVAYTIDLLERALRDSPRDLAIVALVTLAIALSDPSILENEERLQQAISSVSNSIVYAIALPFDVPPEEADA